MTSFDPAEHPRTGDGQFTTKVRAEPDFMLRAGHDPAAVAHVRAVAELLGNGDEDDRDEVPLLRFIGREFAAGRGALPSTPTRTRSRRGSASRWTSTGRPPWSATAAERPAPGAAHLPAMTTLQTPAPLVHQSLNATSRPAPPGRWPGSSSTGS